MKTLLILRHAKSSWNHPGLADHERPLNKRGKRDAPRMGRLLQDENLVPDLIITSTARRARKTAQKIAGASGYAAEIVKTGALYHAYLDDYIAVLRQLGADHERVMLVGHNPGLEDLVADLTGQAVRMTTAALAQVSLPIESWAELTTLTKGELINLWRPKEVTPAR